MGSYLSINIALDFYSAFICSIIIFSIFIYNKNRTKIDFYFSITCFVCLILSVSDAIAWLVDGKTGDFYTFFVPAIQFVFYECGILICNVYIVFLLNLIRPGKDNTLSKRINFICGLGFNVFLIINFFTPVYYYFDENNVYHRANGFWISLVFQFILYVLASYLIVSRKTTIKKRHKIVLGSFIIFPFITQGLQTIFYGVSFVTIGITLSFFVISIALNTLLKNSVRSKKQAISKDEDRILSIQNNTISALANLVESRDSDTGNHVKRTSIYVKLLATAAKEAGLHPEYLTDEKILLLEKAAPLHDIGKIIVPDYILKKPDKLTDDEFDTMKKHTIEGNRIVTEVLGLGNDREYINTAKEIATSHHEKWNGTGYPYKLAGEKIPLSARIMAFADVFDALVSPRCYKQPFSIDKAFEIITKDSGIHFDPELVPVFISLRSELELVMKTYGGEN